MNTSSNTSTLQVIRQLVTAVTNAQLYTLEHPQVQYAIEQCLTLLKKTWAERQRISLIIVEDDLIDEGVILPPLLHCGKFCRLLTERGISHVKIKVGVDSEELTLFISQLAFAVAAEGAQSTQHIRLGKAESTQAGQIDGEKTQTSMAADEVREQLKKFSEEEADRFLDLYEAVHHKRKFNMSGITELVSDLVRLFLNQADPLLALAPLRAMDEYTFTHATNVCILNLAQSKSLGLSGTTLYSVGVAGMLHDVGKMFVPEEILNKQEKLTEDEWQLIRQHPVRGAHYLSDYNGLPPLALVTAFEHHLRFDRKGYPAVPSNWQLNLCSQMTMISDVFDAIRSFRAYQNTLDNEGAINALQNGAGSAFHPLLVQNFLHLLNQIKP